MKNLIRKEVVFIVILITYIFILYNIFYSLSKSYGYILAYRQAISTLCITYITETLNQRIR
jgi:hypothetical protein